MAERRVFWKIADNPLTDLAIRQVEAERDEVYEWGWTIPECSWVLTESDDLFETQVAAVEHLMTVQQERVERAEAEIAVARRMLGLIADRYTAVSSTSQVAGGGDDCGEATRRVAQTAD